MRACDGTSDDAYSNFKGHRFAIGRIGFLKVEQFFHTAKAILCGDFESAVGMVTTTGGPALRSLRTLSISVCILAKILVEYFCHKSSQCLPNKTS